MTSYKHLLEDAQNTGLETLAQAYVQSKIDQLAAVVDMLGSAQEGHLFDEHAEYLHTRIIYLESAAARYLEMNRPPNHWESTDIGNCTWHAGITRKALADMDEHHDAVVERVYNQAIRMLDALADPKLLSSATAALDDVYRHSRPETVTQYKLLDQVYLLGNEDTLKLSTKAERLNAQLHVPVGIRRAKAELLLALANGSSDMGMVSNIGAPQQDETLIKTLANYFVDLSLQERGAANAHVQGGYRMYINTAYHSLRAAVLSGKIDHDAIAMLGQEFHDGQHGQLDRGATLNVFHTIRQERQLGLVLHDIGEGRGELSSVGDYKGLSREAERALRQGKDVVEHAVSVSQLEYSRPEGVPDEKWSSVRNRIHHGYAIVEDPKSFEGVRAKVVDHGESQRTHIYINEARFISGVTRRSYQRADRGEREKMMNYLTEPLYDKQVMVGNVVDYTVKNGPNALEKKISHTDPMLAAIQQASYAALEKEALHIQEKIHAAISVRNPKGFPGSDGGRGR